MSEEKGLSEKTIDFWIDKISDKWNMDVDDLSELTYKDFDLIFTRGLDLDKTVYGSDTEHCQCGKYCKNLFVVRLENTSKYLHNVGCDCIRFFSNELWRDAKQIVKDTKFCQHCKTQLCPKNTLHKKLKICEVCFWDKYAENLPDYYHFFELPKKLAVKIHKRKRIWFDRKKGKLYYNMFLGNGEFAKYYL